MCNRRGRVTGRVILGLGLGLWAVMIMAGASAAGPNEGGMLVVHDTGFTYTADGGLPPASPAPTCASVDNELPVGLPPSAAGHIWKVYAAFPQAASPRLKALCFGATFPPGVTVLAGGVEADVFELPTAGWPHYSGYGVMMSFFNLRTDTVVECYWLAGYGDAGAWQLASHPTQLNMFVDDAFPPIEDEIRGLGSIGFGEPGDTYCPDDVQVGACCYPDGGCTILERTACETAGAMFRGVGFACDPDPCYAGACCLPSGQCFIALPEECQYAGYFIGPSVPCAPFPCPAPTACCVGGGCYLVPAWDCELIGGWPLPDVPSCDPNPCEPAVACCLPDQTCTDIPPVQCEALGGTPHPGQHCYDNPCGQFGACCLSDGACVVVNEAQCAEQGGSFLGTGTSCVPNPCESTPVERTSWGRIKSQYR